MSIATPPSSSIAVPPPILMRRWTVDEYHLMIQAGVFARDERFELLEGWIVPKMSRNPPHDAAMDLTREQLERRLPKGWRIRIQSAITTRDSEPEPDLAIVRGTARDYATRHPGSADIALIVEVAESSLLQDRREKAHVYARAGIAVYWIVNLVESQVEVYTGSIGTAATSNHYPQPRNYSLTEAVPFTIEGAAGRFHPSPRTAPLAAHDALTYPSPPIHFRPMCLGAFNARE